MSKKISVSQAINDAICEEMARDEKVYMMGEDVGVFGGCFGVTTGILDKFGPERVIDTPITEAIICSMGVGSAITGKRPIVELMFADFCSLGFDAILMQAAKLRYNSNGTATVPIVFRGVQGAGIGGGMHHSNNIEAWFMNAPGLVVCAPSTADDAKGMLKAAIRSDNPVLFLEHKMSYAEKGEVTEGDYTIPLGKADVVKEGKDVTVIAGQWMRSHAEEAIREVEKEGISVELIDPRTIMPYDKEAFCKSAKKTGRVIIVNEHPKTGSIAGEYADAIQEECFKELKAPIQRVCGFDVSIPFGPEENFIFPTKESIAEAIRNIMK